MTRPRKSCGAKTTRCETCGCHRSHHRQVDDGRGACGCGKCSWFTARACRVSIIGRGGRCRVHGGSSLAGIAHPGFRTGQHSRPRWWLSVPGALGEQFEAAWRDPTLTTLRQSIALNDSLITSYLATLKRTPGTITRRQQDRILELLDQHRRLILAEAQRQRDLSLYVTAAQFRAFTGIMAELIVEFIPDLKHRAEIHRRVQAALISIPKLDDATLKGLDRDEHEG